MGCVTGSERDVLTRALASARRHVLAQLEDLVDEQLRRPVAPSGWAPLGLVRHLTLSDERYWFEVAVAGGPLDFWPQGPDADWQVSPDDTAAAVITAYTEAIARSDAIIADTDLDAPPAAPEPDWEAVGLSFPNLRAILLHVIVETSTHAGQLDLVRELIDGRQHIVL